MPELFYPICAILLGFLGLVWSADRFVSGSAAIAKAAGLPPLVIGLTIVSFGTSAPEVLVSLNAAMSGAGELAVGNAMGSNLANLGLVLGATALIARLPIQSSLLRHEMPVLLGVTVISGWFLWDTTLTFGEGLALLLLLIPVLAYLVFAKKSTLTSAEAEAEQAIPALSAKAAAGWFVIGLVLLVFSARILVWGAIGTARAFDVSSLVIGLTVVAVGTSLPELAASVASALRGHHDIAIGNVIGSNIFNLLAVMSIPALFYPLEMEPMVFTRDYLCMAGLTGILALTVFVSWFRRGNRKQAGLGKALGVVMLASYVGYYVWLFQTL